MHCLSASSFEMCINQPFGGYQPYRPYTSASLVLILTKPRRCLSMPFYRRPAKYYTNVGPVNLWNLFVEQCDHCLIRPSLTLTLPGTERIQTLAVISRSVLCCHSNETRAPIANPTNSGEPEGTRALPFPKSHLGPCNSVGMQRETDRHTETDDSDQYTFRLGYVSRENV